MAKTQGNIEILVLVALARLSGQGYGVTIREEILAVTGRDVSVAAVYAALDRLEQQKLVEPWLSAPRAERGGRARRHFRLSLEGERALRLEREVMARLWEGVALGSEPGSS
jgi:DNA-binding PadR family transcriptional regulator